MSQKNVNKFLAGAVTATMVATAVVTPAMAASFTDTGKLPAQIKGEVDRAVELGYFQDSEKFNPAASITRGQVALVIARQVSGVAANDIAGLKAYVAKHGLEEKVTPFADVKKGETELYYASLIVKNAGAFTQDSLNPASNITRSQMAKVVVTAFDLKMNEDNKKEITDISKVSNKEYIEILASNGVTEPQNGKFNPGNNVTRSQMASFLVRAHDGVKEEVTAPEVVSVKAINATSAKVTFKGALPTGVDFSNFEIDGGLVVSDAKVSADRKSVELTFNRDLTRDREYTITVSGVKDAEGIDYPDTTGKFTWTVAEGVTVALDATVLEQGEVTGLTVKDEGGKLVKDAVVNVRSYNENLVTVNNTTKPEEIKLTAKNLAGATDIEVITTLPDGSVLTNTFKVTVKEAVTTVANKGYSLVDDANNLTYEYDNTVAFAKYATAVTSLVVDEEKELVAFTETNGNPDVDPISFEDATVKTSNGVVATAVIDPSTDNLVVTGHAVGTATLSVTLKDGTKKSFPITVTAEPKLTDVAVDVTSIKLSDETTTGTTGVEGVNEHTVTVSAKDQFGKDIEFGTEGKVTVSSSTDGITLSDTELDFGTTPGEDKKDSFTVTAQKDKTVSNATVRVSYFAKKTDAKPTAVKTIKVNVVDIDPAATAADLDVVAPASEIDANAKNIKASLFNEIDLTDSVAYELDSKGNRIAKATITDATLATKDENNEDVVINSGVIGFVDGADQALTYSNASGTVSVEVTDGTITKVVPVKYKNSAVIPASAKVATTPVSIKIPTATPFSIEKIIFGAIDANDATTGAKQLILDDITAPTINSGVIGVSKTAKNGGYFYNKPLVTVTGTDGKVLPTGVSLYGTELNEFANHAGLWNNAFVKEHQVTKFKVGGFDVDFAITNEVKSTGATVTEATGVTLAAAEDYATFTLVVKGIYIEGADQTKENNLLASPVQVNVNVAGK